MMSDAICNMEDLTVFFKGRIKKALEMTQNEIYNVIQNHITDYYKEYTPHIYNRTWKLLNSLYKTKLVIDGNILVCKVEIDNNYLSYTYPGNSIEPHISNYNPATGLDVVTWANNHSHGGMYDDDYSNFWDDSMAEIGMEPGLLYIMKKNLIKCGIPVE